MIDVPDEFVRGQAFLSVANIHVVVKDTLHWKRHLAFRDFLRAHADVRDEYGQLKTELTQHEYKDTNDYNAAKESFIKQTQAQALTWYKSRHTADESNYSGGPNPLAADALRSAPRMKLTMNLQYWSIERAAGLIRVLIIVATGPGFAMFWLGAPSDGASSVQKHHSDAGTNSRTGMVGNLIIE